MATVGDASARSWVDFKTVKASVTMQMVVDHYHLKLKRKGDELRGLCPIHPADDKQQKRSFTANTEKNCFHCFVCRARGDVLDFVKAKERCTLREAALMLAEWFGVGEASGSTGAS